MILMLAPAANWVFGAAPSGATYVSNNLALIQIVNDSAADQVALQNAGCFTLSPFGGWGNFGFLTLADLYAADTGSILVGITGYPQYTVASVFSDGTPANCGTWAKSTTGNGSGAWTQVSTETLATIAGTVASAVAATIADAAAAAASAATAASDAAGVSEAAAAAAASALAAADSASTATIEAGTAGAAATAAAASATEALNAAQATGISTIFATYADASAAAGSLPNGLVQVIADETHGGDRTIYSVTSHVLTFEIDLSPAATSFRSQAAAKLGVVAAGVGYLMTAGYAEPGDGGQGLYEQVDAIPQVNGVNLVDGAGNPVGWFTTADAKIWEYVPEPAGVNAFAFAPGIDPTGTADSWQGLQNAVDFGTYYAGRKVIANGTFKMSDVLQLGYGDVFTCAILEGDEYNTPGGGLLGGLLLVPTNFDRPTTNIQGGRGSYWRGVAGLGPLGDYYDSLGFCTDTPLIDDTDPDNWNDPALGPNQDSQFAPFACFTLDAYSGDAPDPPYPPRVIPPFITGVGQYGAATSSGCRLDDWGAHGYIAAICEQPNSGGPGNGDNMTVGRGVFSNCKYVWSCGNTEARPLTWGPVSGSVTYSLLNTSVHGSQNGHMANTVLGIDGSGGILFGQFGSAGYLGPTKIQSLYLENWWALGFLGVGSTDDSPFEYDSFEVQFAAQNDVRGYPSANWWSGTGSFSQSAVAFRNGHFSQYNTVLGLFGSDIQLDNVFCEPSYVEASADLTTPQAYLANATAGGVVLGTFGAETPRREQKIRFVGYYLLDPTHANGSVGVVGDGDGVLAYPQYGTPVYARRVSANSGPTTASSGPDTVYAKDWEVEAPQLVYRIAKTSAKITDLAIAGITLTFTYSGDLSPSGMNCFNKGGVFYDDTSFTIFNVTGVVPGTGTVAVTAVAQNNYRSNYATLELGAGAGQVEFTARQAGAGGNGLTVQTLAAAGAGSVVVGTGTVTITPAAAADTANAVAAQVAASGSASLYLTAAATGAGTASIGVNAATPLAGGGTGYELIDPADLTDGGHFIGPSLPAYTPIDPMFGTVTVGSPVITDIKRADGGGSISDSVAVGDWIYNPQYLGPNSGSTQPFGFAAQPIRLTNAGDEGVIAVGANTLTMNGNATCSGTVRLGIFIQGPPA